MSEVCNLRSKPNFSTIVLTNYGASRGKRYVSCYALPPVRSKRTSQRSTEKSIEAKSYATACAQWVRPDHPFKPSIQSDWTICSSLDPIFFVDRKRSLPLLYIAESFFQFLDSR